MTNSTQQQSDKEYNKKYYAANKHKWAGYKKNKKANAASYRERHKERLRDAKLLKTYGITAEQRSEMERAQDGKCAICGTTSPGGPHDTFNVDHCHATGAVRGLLCIECNIGLGKFKDDTALLNKAISYLNSYIMVHNG